ncbi:MAG: hypothetical protein ACI9KE_003412 [Polyangiales bacterium]|jgi:hypothetical protein
MNPSNTRHLLEGSRDSDEELWRKLFKNVKFISSLADGVSPWSARLRALYQHKLAVHCFGLCHLKTSYKAGGRCQIGCVSGFENQSCSRLVSFRLDVQADVDISACGV